MNYFNIKVILRKVILFIFIFCSYSIASDVENFELSSDPCGDLYKKISQNIKSLQNAPYLSRMYFGFEVFFQNLHYQFLCAYSRNRIKI